MKDADLLLRLVEVVLVSECCGVAPLSANASNVRIENKNEQKKVNIGIKLTNFIENFRSSNHELLVGLFQFLEKWMQLV